MKVTRTSLNGGTLWTEIGNAEMGGGGGIYWSSTGHLGPSIPLYTTYARCLTIHRVNEIDVDKSNQAKVIASRS